MGELKAVAERLASRGPAGRDRPSDLVQDALAVAVRRINEGRGPHPDGCDLKAWVCGIMAKIQLRGWRRRRPLSGLEGDRHPAEATSPGDRAGHLEEVSRLARALRRLDEGDRRLLGWRHSDGHTLSEIGASLGISKQAARQRYLKALGRLRLAYEREGPEALGRPREARDAASRD